MKGREKQAIESYQRVKTFLGVYPAPAPATYAGPEDVLDDVISQLTDHSSTQVLGTHLSQSEQRRQKSLMRKLREHQMRPIVAIAKSEIEAEPGIEKALRLPPKGISPVKLVAAAQAMREAAALFAPVFVKKGRPENFLEQLTAAIEAVTKSTSGRARILGTRVGAKAGIAQEVRRGRRAVEMLDSIVTPAFEGNDVVLAAWRAAKKVYANGSAGGAVPAPAPQPTQVAPVIKPAAA
jgi:hypothetical protein